jgi:hypothetical protein
MGTSTSSFSGTGTEIPIPGALSEVLIMTAVALERILQRFPFIRPLGEAVQGWLGEEPARRGAAAVKEFLSGTWLGHPLHPAPTNLPIGAWTGAAILDIADRGSGGGLGHAAQSPATVDNSILDTWVERERVEVRRREP